MPIAIAEAVHLVLDRRAIAWSLAFDRAGEERRIVQPGADDIMGGDVCAGHRAGQLRQARAIRHRRHAPRVFVGGLGGQPRPVDRATVEARRSAGLEAAHGEAERAELFAELKRRAFADTPAGLTLAAAIDAAAEESAGGENDGGCRDRAVVGEADAGQAIVVKRQRRRLALDDRKVGGAGEQVVDGRAVAAAVGLDARPLDG